MNESEMRTEGREPQFERQLTEALRRVDAPEGFAGRVIARAAERSTPDALRLQPRLRKSHGRSWIRAWSGGSAAAALALALALLAASQTRARRERERAVLAQQQFAAAIRVTEHALDQASEQLKSAGLDLDN